jgi:predicted DNA-binding protein YlxM (UPF0122 family)
MSDDLKKRRPLDSSRINIHEDYELNWWADHLDVSKQAISNAVKAVGTSAAAVKKYLGK